VARAVAAKVAGRVVARVVAVAWVGDSGGGAATAAAVA